MRAAEAAKNTANLIESTVKKVKEGSELVENTDKEFREVTASVGKSGELVGEISAASQEQAQGIEQVNKAVSEMDKVVQQNAANAEESASASEEMNAQAERMKEFVEGLVTLVGGGNGNRTQEYAGPAKSTKTLIGAVKKSAQAFPLKGRNRMSVLMERIWPAWANGDPALIRSSLLTIRRSHNSRPTQQAGVSSMNSPLSILSVIHLSYIYNKSGE